MYRMFCPESRFHIPDSTFHASQLTSTNQPLCTQYVPFAVPPPGPCSYPNPIVDTRFAVCGPAELGPAATVRMANRPIKKTQGPECEYGVRNRSHSGACSKWSCLQSRVRTSSRSSFQPAAFSGIEREVRRS